MGSYSSPNGSQPPLKKCQLTKNNIILLQQNLSETCHFRVAEQSVMQRTKPNLALPLLLLGMQKLGLQGYQNIALEVWASLGQRAQPQVGEEG